MTSTCPRFSTLSVDGKDARAAARPSALPANAVNAWASDCDDCPKDRIASASSPADLSSPERSGAEDPAGEGEAPPAKPPPARYRTGPPLARKCRRSRLAGPIELTAARE